MTLKIAFQLKDGENKIYCLDFTSTPDGEGKLKVSEFAAKADKNQTEKILPAELINFKFC